MYDFAIVALLGLAIWKTVGMVLGFAGRDIASPVRTLVTLALGIVAAFVLDYSLFAAWGVEIGNADLGTVMTGLIVGSMAYVWHYAIGLLEATGRRSRDEARDLETRGPRAA